jgi:hypothetical protein
MILNRQLDDMGLAFVNLRKYSSFHLVNFLINFCSKNEKEDFFGTDKHDTGTELSVDENKILFSVSNNKSEFAEKADFHNRGFKTLDGEMRVEDISRKKKSRLSGEKIVDREMISYFLEKANVQFLPEDIFYIFKAFGTNKDYLSIEDFDLAMNCNIWNI